MAEEKKKRGRAAKVEHIARDSAGKYVYQGGFYKYTGEGKLTGRQAKAVFLGLSAAAAAAAVACGCFDVPGMKNCFYVLLPYAGSLLGSVSVLWAVCRILYWGNPLREYVYHATVLKIPGRGLLTAAFTACTLAGEICFLLRNGTGDAGVLKTALFFLLQAGVLAAALTLRSLALVPAWEKIEQNA
ncbi:MAG: hypothetical protein Q4C58_00265 [Eubacteriales bacterium]|nr:hypothetical protein [Eubacteriales bacterium]